MRVSIAPLWNWKMKTLLCELLEAVFQSHLYGIERKVTHDCKQEAERFNRTFMELKVGTHPRASLACSVSIAPLWNWKLLVADECSHVFVFQSHLYGIESAFAPCARKTTLCFNRTFMELKVGGLLHFREPKGRFNRTFMELKDPKFTLAVKGFYVSIAPLWNWKRPTSYGSTSNASFNRTFMELKGHYLNKGQEACMFQSHLYGIESSVNHERIDELVVSIAPLWNWKLPYFFTYVMSSCFNRTFMELKVLALWHKSKFFVVSIAPLWNWKIYESGITAMEGSVSIAPLWNWKSGGGARCLAAQWFQSHLYGIERPLPFTYFDLPWLFQSHLYGIESFEKLLLITRNP